MTSRNAGFVRYSSGGDFVPDTLTVSFSSGLVELRLAALSQDCTLVSVLTSSEARSLAVMLFDAANRCEEEAMEYPKNVIMTCPNGHGGSIHVIRHSADQRDSCASCGAPLEEVKAKDKATRGSE